LRISNDQKERIREDPFFGEDEEFKLLVSLIQSLDEVGIFSFAYPKEKYSQAIGMLGWKSGGVLRMEGHEANEWINYVSKLVSNFIRLKEEEDVILC
jgi:hypothetical protein